MLNLGFENYLKQILGDTQFNKLRPSEAFRRGMQTFNDHVKRSFTSVDDEFLVGFPKARLNDDPINELDCDQLMLKGYVSLAHTYWHRHR